MLEKIKNSLMGLMIVPIFMFAMVGFNLTTPLSNQVAAEDYTMSKGASAAKGTEQATTLFGDDGIFKTITNIALYLIGAVSVLMLIYGGIKYTISGGDANAVTSAKNTILYAIVGIVVALLAFAIVNFVLTSLITT